MLVKREIGVRVCMIQTTNTESQRLPKKEEASSSAGAATVVAGAAFASSIKGAQAQTSSEDSAIKGAVQDGKKWCAKFAKGQKMFPKVGAFEKAVEHSRVIE